MPKILIVGILLFGSVFSYAQTTIKGRVIDHLSGKGLSYSTLSLVKAKDSTLVTFSRADASGNFQFAGINKDKYLIAASYVGYQPLWLTVNANFDDPLYDMGMIKMKDIASLENVTVTDKRPPVSIVNDTLEFNTENFRTQPNAVVEDMLKKMPGVIVENDGTIKVNGQTVRRFLVNGKEFFTGDPKMATKNLSADVVDKVQVFEKKSDQSEFTGIDDGNREKTINLKLKKDKANAVFGRVTAGAGNKERYDLQANINRFKGDEQQSFIGMGNSVNKQGFSMQDAMNFTGELARGMRNGGGVVMRTNDDNTNGLPVTGLGQNQQGIAETFAGGLNYNNTWNKRKTDFNGSYTTSNIHLLTDKTTLTQNLLPQNPFNQADSSNSIRNINQHRFTATIDQKIDSFTSFKMTPAITFQKNQSTSNSTYATVNSQQRKLNDGYSNLASSAEAVNFTNNLLIRRKFQKKGRTISANISMGYNHSSSRGTQQSANSFYDYLQNSVDSVVNQQSSLNAITKNIGGSFVYTEPAGKHSLFELSSFYNINTGESGKKTFDLSKGNNNYDSLNLRLTNNFKSEYRYGGGGLRFRANKNKTTFSMGAQLQLATLQGTNFTHQSKVNQSFSDILPNLNYQYQFTRSKSFRLDYTTSVIQPSITQLQPVADISNPLNISIGNPDLHRQYNHSVNLNYFGVNIASRKNLFLLVNANFIESAIVSSDETKLNGSRTTRPVNSNGVYNVFGNLNYGFPFRALKSRIEIESNIVYNHNVAFLNGERNIIKSTTVGPRLNYNIDIDTVIMLQVSARVSYNKARYQLQPRLNNDYFQQTYSIDLTNFLPAGLTVNNLFSYILNTGRADGFNTKVPLWNASVARSFMKNKRAELKFSVYDILNRNVGITRTVNQNYIVDQKYNVLNRYILVSFTYSLNRSGLTGGPRAVFRRIGD